MTMELSEEEQAATERYDAMVKSPLKLSPEASERIKARVASGDFPPRRKVRRRNDESGDGS